MASEKSKVITLFNADRGAALALGHWSRLVDKVVSFVLRGEPAAWRSETSPFWQPLGTSTLVRIIQALTVPSSPALWIELQDVHHTILHFDTREDLRFQIGAELGLLALRQNKLRERGVFLSAVEENRMRIRVPHR